MIRMIGSTTRALVLTAASTFAVSPAQAQGRSSRTDIDTTFAFDRTGTVTVGNGAVTIVVTGTDQPTIRVRARADRGTFRFETSPKHVTIDPTRSTDDATIEIQIPRGARVEAQTNSGDITIRGTRGDVDAQTSSGDIQISDVRDVSAGSLSGDIGIEHAGGVTATTNNGDLTISDANGAIEATSVSGDVGLDGVISKSVRTSTTSGDVSYAGTIDPQGRYEFTTHSGDIDLSIPKDASAQVGVTTWNGDIDSDFPITLKPNTNTARDVTKHYSFTIGAGTAHITAEAFSGDITIRSRGR